MADKLPHLSIIGSGAVGTALGTEFFKKGYPIVTVINRTGPSAVKLARTVGCKKVSAQLSDLSQNTEIILIAVPDGAVRSVGAELARVRRLKFKKLLIIHTSGVHAAEVLHPLKKKGASVCSMHPIQSFPDTGRTGRIQPKLKGIYYGIEGDDQVVPKVEKLVRDLEGKSVIIRKELKPLYHVGCNFASGYMTIYLNTISDIAQRLNLKASWTEVFGHLMTSTMENVVKAGAPAALTGPIIRGDLVTIDLHLEALSENAPQHLPMYTVGGIEAARIAKENAMISQEMFDEIITKFRKFIQTTSFKKSAKVKP